nr:hypothetical protein [Streptomyces xiaopingdaonensis]
MPRPPQLPRPARRTMTVLHACSSASWLGLSVGLLALGLTGGATESAATKEAAYRAMHLFGDWLLVPLALLTLLTGLALGLGTHWGLLRHYWVLVKLTLTLATATATLFALRPRVSAAAEAAAAGEEVEAGDLIAAPVVSLSLYLFMMALSLLKPWGRTRIGRRALAEERLARTRTAARPAADSRTAGAASVE